MLIVQDNEEGVSYELHPEEQDKIFTDQTDDGKDIVIVAGRVVRVDTPSARMQQATHATYGAGEKKHPLLVKSNKPSTYVPEPTVKVENSEEALLDRLAERLGIELKPATVDEGDSTDLVTGKQATGKVAQAPVKEEAKKDAKN